RGGLAAGARAHGVSPGQPACAGPGGRRLAATAVRRGTRGDGGGTGGHADPGRGALRARGGRLRAWRPCAFARGRRPPCATHPRPARGPPDRGRRAVRQVTRAPFDASPTAAAARRFALLRLGSAALPIGGYSYSQALEA